ncbi:replication protein A 70 kDa DNA-binding subunit B, partial [Tanacetum coccineum]
KIEKRESYSLLDRLIRLILTLPVSTATTERGFSAMKIFKTRLQNKMANKFLADSLIVHIEKEIAETFDSKSIIDVFKNLKVRRAKFLGWGCNSKLSKSFPQYNKLHTIFVKDTTKGLQANGVAVKVEDVVPENQIITCASSFNRNKEIVSSKRKRTQGNDLNGNHVESKVANQGINAVNDTMSKIETQMKDLPCLKLDERLMAMSVIGRSEPLSVMFDQLDEDGKVRMAQMVTVGAIN